MLKSLSGALQLMRYFTAEQSVWGVRELAAASGVHRAVVQRVLATFAEEGFLVQDDLGRYALGLRWFELGEIVRHTLSPTDVVKPALSRLAQQTGETVFLSLLDGHEGLCLDMAHSGQPLRFSIEEGQRFALDTGSHGKAMLAFQSSTLCDEVCQKAHQQAREHAHRHVPDRQVLDAHLARIRETGWAYTSEEAVPGVSGLAIPLWSKDKRTVIGSLAIAGPVQRLDEQAVPKFLDALHEARQTVERAIGLIKRA